MKPYQRAFLAVYLVLLREDRVLLIRRAGTGYYDGQWSLPAGHVDDGESLTQAASREAREETSLVITPERWHLAGMLHRRTAERQIIDTFMLARHWVGEPANCEPHKCDAMGFFAPESFPAPMVDYVAPMLARICAAPGATHFAEQGWPQ